MGKSRGRTATVYFISAGSLVFIVLACVLYVQRDHFLVPYRVGQFLSNQEMSQADQMWLLDRKGAALPAVLNCLSKEDETACRRAGALVVLMLADNRGASDPETSRLPITVSAKILQMYSQFSVAGKQQAIAIASDVLNRCLGSWSPHVATGLETAGAIVLLGLDEQNDAIRRHVLAETPRIWSWHGSDGVAHSLVEQWKQACYERTLKMLSDESAAIRSAAALALVGAPFHEGDHQLIRLLNDESTDVRKAALVAVGKSAADSLTSDQKSSLIGYLRDKDMEVQRAARELLLNAGVSETVLQVATLSRSPEANERAKAVGLAMDVLDDPAPLLLELANDPAPAVRLQVARAALTSTNPDVQAQLKKMADGDSDLLVRETIATILKAENTSKTRAN